MTETFVIVSIGIYGATITVVLALNFEREGVRGTKRKDLGKLRKTERQLVVVQTTVLTKFLDFGMEAQKQVFYQLRKVLEFVRF